MKKYNYGASIAFLLLAGYVFWATKDFKPVVSGAPGPGVWPRIVAATMAFLAIILAAQTLVAQMREKKMQRESDNVEEPVIDWKSPGVRTVLIMIAIFAGFLGVLAIFGLLIALFLLCVAIMLLLGERRIIWLALYPAAIVAFIYVFFGIFLRLNLPTPIFM